MAGLKSSFQNFKTELNRNVDKPTDENDQSKGQKCFSIRPKPLSKARPQRQERQFISLCLSRTNIYQVRALICYTNK